MRQLEIKEYTILVDNDDYDRVKALAWTPVTKGNHTYFINNHTTRKELHQFILGKKENFIIDHINQNTLDNRKTNLRHTDKSVNAYNRSIPRDDNTSGFNGVSWSKDKNKWLARMQIGDDYKFLGYFNDKIEAVKKIDEEDTKLFGKPRRKRRLVFADPHGNYQALIQTFTRANIDYEKDKIICLGDVCDGFTQTYEVVEELLKIKNLVFVLGNHDDFFMNYLLNGRAIGGWLHQGGIATVNSYLHHNGSPKIQVDTKLSHATYVKDYSKLLNNLIVPITHQDLFNRAVLYHKEDNMVFVHGGFDETKSVENQSKITLLWDRDLIKTAMKQKIRNYDKVFVGHTSTQFCSIDNTTKPLKFHNLWVLDTGAGWNGKLTIMDIDTEEYWQSDKFEGQQ